MTEEKKITADSNRKDLSADSFFELKEILTKLSKAVNENTAAVKELTGQLADGQKNTTEQLSALSGSIDKMSKCNASESRLIGKIMKDIINSHRRFIENILKLLEAHNVLDRAQLLCNTAPKAVPKKEAEKTAHTTENEADKPKKRGRKPAAANADKPQTGFDDAYKELWNTLNNYYTNNGK